MVPKSVHNEEPSEYFFLKTNNEIQKPFLLSHFNLVLHKIKQSGGGGHPKLETDAEKETHRILLDSLEAMWGQIGDLVEWKVSGGGLQQKK